MLGCECGSAYAEICLCVDKSPCVVMAAKRVAYQKQVWRQVAGCIRTVSVEASLVQMVVADHIIVVWTVLGTHQLTFQLAVHYPCVHHG